MCSSDLSIFFNDTATTEIYTLSLHDALRSVDVGLLPQIKEIDGEKRKGIAGVQIGSHINGWNLDDPRIFPILEAAQDLDLSVFVHPWQMLGSDRMNLYWLPWLVYICSYGYRRSRNECAYS